MVSVVTSFSPRLSRSRTIFEMVCSTRSGSTLRLRSAISTERASLSRSNGTRRPLRLMTTSSRNCTRSQVVEGGNAEAASQAQAAPADRRRILGRTRVLHLGIETAAARTAHARLPHLVVFVMAGLVPAIHDL